MITKNYFIAAGAAESLPGRYNIIYSTMRRILGLVHIYISDLWFGISTAFNMIIMIVLISSKRQKTTSFEHIFYDCW